MSFERTLSELREFSYREFKRWPRDIWLISISIHCVLTTGMRRVSPSSSPVPPSAPCPIYVSRYLAKLNHTSLALFLGTGNATPDLPTAMMERLYTSPTYGMWYPVDPKSLSSNLPPMVVFPESTDFYTKWQKSLEERNVKVGMVGGIGCFVHLRSGRVYAWYRGIAWESPRPLIPCLQAMREATPTIATSRHPMPFSSLILLVFSRCLLLRAPSPE